MWNQIIVGCLAVISVLAASADARCDDDYFDLGDFHCEVETDSPEAQKWFNRGLALCYAFNHEEAVPCFEKAHAADPTMPMALWGMAYAWGPNINNLPIEAHQIAQAQLATRLAQTLAKQTTAFERDLAKALATRYEVPVPEDREPLNEAYAGEMRRLYERYPDKPLVRAAFAESLMILRPWKHWTVDGKPAPETPELVQVLEDGLQKWPNHPALCHYYIHVMEASPTPEKALPAANRIRNMMPEAGHLVHMPSHIDVRLGNYPRVIEANRKAIDVDSKFVEREGRHNFYTFYRIHNFHFLVYGAMFDGQSELALRTAREIPHQIPRDMLREQTDFLDAFLPIPLHVLIRFGRWDEILQEPEPDDYLPMSRATWHYARGIAYSAKGELALAKKEQKAFREMRDTVPETSALFNNLSKDILGVAEAMLVGEIAYREGKYETAFEHLRDAVRRDDALNYDEPWGWMQPARHAYGALLLEQKRASEAERVYRADLKRHPKNLWSLHGLAESLRMQGKSEQAATVRQAFDEASKRADVEVDCSCFCRRL